VVKVLPESKGTGIPGIGNHLNGQGGNSESSCDAQRFCRFHIANSGAGVSMKPSAGGSAEYRTGHGYAPPFDATAALCQNSDKSRANTLHRSFLRDPLLRAEYRAHGQLAIQLAGCSGEKKNSGTGSLAKPLLKPAASGPPSDSASEYGQMRKERTKEFRFFVQTTGQ
jgi:hypothetical protein